MIDVKVITSSETLYSLHAPVPNVRAVGDGMIEVWYDRLSAQGEPLPQESPRIQVMVKTQVPGGDDPDQTTFPVNEGLAPAIVPDGKIEPPIPPEGIAVEVRPWINMTQGDRLRLFWGAQSVQMPALDESQVGASVIVRVPPEVIEAAGDGEALVVTYEIRDMVNNWSGRAPAAYVDVETGEAIYVAPGVLQATDGVLDYDALNGANATVVILQNGDMATGDEVTLIFEGKSYDGRDVEHSESQPLTSAMMMFDLPNAVIAQVVPGEGSVFYRVSTAAVAKGRSYRTGFTVIGKPAELPAPVIPQAEDGVLNLSSFTGNPLVTVAPWPQIAVGQKVWLRCYGMLAAGGVDTIVIWAGAGVSAEEVVAGLSVGIPRARLEALENGSELRVELKVTFDGSGDEAQAVIFPELRVTMTVERDFIVDPGQMILDAFNVKYTGWPRTGAYVPGNMKVREASGGVFPYHYTSSNARVASVNAAGMVVGESNGIATITVSDAAGATASFDVLVSNVYAPSIHTTPNFTFAQAIAWKDSIENARAIDSEEIAAIRIEYSRAHVGPVGSLVWTCARTGCGENAALVLRHEDAPPAISCRAGANGYAICLRPFSI